MKHILALVLLFSAAQAAPTSNPGLRGSGDLVGYSPSRDVPVKNTSVQYELVKGQKEDADVGVYLDFKDVKNPQPIRGSHGGTDPGPSMPSLSLYLSGNNGDEDWNGMLTR